MDHSTSKNRLSDSGDESLHCCDANRATQQFYTELHSFENGSEEWNELIQREMDDSNAFVQIMCFREISRTGDERWLDDLFSRVEREMDTCVLSAIYHAIAQLGGYESPEDYARLFETADTSRRSAAMIVLDSMRSADAIKILLELHETDSDWSMRWIAAQRLAYLGSDVGLKELLESLGCREFYNRVEAACALCALGNDVGLKHVRKLLVEEAELSSLERTNLAFAADRLLESCDAEYARPDTTSGMPQRPPSDWHRPILKRASEWVETKLQG